MCGIGLHLTLADFRSIARHPRSVLVGLAGHYLLLPLLGFGIAWLLPSTAPCSPSDWC
jgi:BASS family bile acid:Na+ symporter